MKQRKTRKPYRAVAVKTKLSRSILERSDSERLVVAIDVAKEKRVAAVMDDDQTVLVTVKWTHPGESEAFYGFVEGLGSEREVDVVMEPTGTYGDGLTPTF